VFIHSRLATVGYWQLIENSDLFNLGNGRIQHEDQLPLPVLGVSLHPHPHNQLHHPVDYQQCPVWAGELEVLCQRSGKSSHLVFFRFLPNLILQIIHSFSKFISLKSIVIAKISEKLNLALKEWKN
jgi:hypothetical protein